jgi:hypothetical protein
VNALRILLAFVVAAFVLWFAHRRIFPAKKSTALGTTVMDTGDPSSVRYAIAFDAVVFTIIGLAAAVAAAPQWQMAFLLSGTCLLIGAFFGLLFGYPQGVAQTSAAQPSHQLPQPPEQTPAGNNSSAGDLATTADAAAAGHATTTANSTAAENSTAEADTAAKPATSDNGTAVANGTSATNGGIAWSAAGNRPPQSTPQKNLIAESASTLGKVIAGFTLAKADPLVHHFHQICNVVGPALGQQHSPDAGVVLAGAIMLYFFATGFFSGLLLPSYFMSGKFG